jgi:signal transduction histidine kinase
MAEEATPGISALDVVMAGSVTALAAITVVTVEGYQGGTTRLAVAMLLQSAPLIWRRAAPLRAAALSAIGVAIEVAGVPAYGDIAGLLGYLILAYSIPRWAAGRDRALGIAILAVGFVVHLAAEPHGSVLQAISSVVSVALVTAAVGALGHIVRTRSDRLVALEADAVRREADFTTERTLVVQEERRRIARELHDIVGHALAAIALSAGGAEQLVPDGAGEVRQALHLIRATSSDASAEVRRLVGLLRTEGDADGTTPQPTLASVVDLTRRATAAGLPVHLRFDVDGLIVPAGVQLAAYRLVQEGLTNVLKHAGSTPTEVRVEEIEGRIEVEVRNDKVDEAPVSSTSAGLGHGIVGLSERVALYGGTLAAGPLPSGGYALSASIPL